MSPGQLMATAVREGRPRPFFIHSPPGRRGEGGCPGTAGSPLGPQGAQESAPVRTSPERPQQHGVPAPGRRGEGAAQGPAGMAAPGPLERTLLPGWDPRRRLRQQREGRGSDFRFGCEDRSSGCHAAWACPVSWAAAQQPPGPRRRRCPPFLNQTPSTRGRCWSHRRRATVMGGYF